MVKIGHVNNRDFGSRGGFRSPEKDRRQSQGKASREWAQHKLFHYALMVVDRTGTVSEGGDFLFTRAGIRESRGS